MAAAFAALVGTTTHGQNPAVVAKVPCRPIEEFEDFLQIGRRHRLPVVKPGLPV